MLEEFRILIQIGQRYVLKIFWINISHLLAILWYETQTRVDCFTALLGLIFLPIYLDFTIGDDPILTKQCGYQFSSTRTHQTGNPENFTSTDIEAYPVQDFSIGILWVCCLQGFHSNTTSPGFAIPFGKAFLHFPAHHVFNQIILGYIFCGLGGNNFAIPHYCHSIGD